MARIYETEDKSLEVQEHLEKAQREIGKAMQCIEDCYDEDDHYGERADYNDEDGLEHMRRLDRYGARESMGYRRSRRTGRFM